MKSKLYDTIGGFVTVPNTVVELLPTIGTEAFCLFCFLRYRTNGQTGDAFPSYDNIQAGTGLTRRKIAAAIRSLEGAGLVERKRRFGGSTIYTLKMPNPISNTVVTTISNTVDTVISNTVVPLTRLNKQDLTNKTETGAKNAPRPRDAMFDAITEVTRVDPKTAGASIGKVKKVLSAAGYTAEDVLKYGTLWWSDTWNKKNGKPPSLWNLQEKIGIVKNGKDDTDATHQPAYPEYQYTKADLESAERINKRRAEARAAGRLSL